MNEYYIPAGAGEAVYTEKRSEFLGHVRMVSSEDEAKGFITEMKKKYHDARHNCWCYILRNGAVRYSDDGEPQGTAGIPMLEVFKREGIENVVCVVTRYFGGILLGAGGLLRAYTKSAKDALDAAGVSVVRRWVNVRIDCPYSLLERMKTELTAFGSVIENIEYAANASITALVPEERVQELSERITDVSAGGTQLRTTGESFRPARIR